MVRRKLTVPESLRIIKLFYNFLDVEGEQVVWGFWNRTQEQFSQACLLYDIAPLQTTPPPFTRSLEFLDVFMTTIVSYLSTGNLHTPTDLWLEEPDHGNKAEERDLLIDALECEPSAVSAMKDLARLMQKTSKYMAMKVNLGARMVEEFNKFRDLQDTLNNLINKVIRGIDTRSSALLKVEAVLDAIQSLVSAMRTFYTREPGEDEFRGMELLFGRNPFLNNLLDNAVDDCMAEAAENDPMIALRVIANLDSREDIPLLQQGYAAAMQLYADIKGIRNDEEDLTRQVERLTVNLNKDIAEMVLEVYGDEDDELESPSVLADMVKQVEELKRRMTSITSMTDQVCVFNKVVFMDEQEERVNISADGFFKRARRKLLAQKDNIQDMKRARQDREKTVLQEVLKTFPKARLSPMNNRRDIVPWINRFKAVKATLKASNVPDWRAQLLNMARESLKMDEDRIATKYMDSLGEFEIYIRNNFVAGLNLIDDLLSELMKKESPTTVKQSIANMQEALVVFGTIKRKKLSPKFTERHFEMLLRVTLTRKDRDEFRSDHAKEKVENRLASSTLLLDIDEEEADEVDWDKTMAEEVEVTSLDSRREFLVKFLERKLIQLKDLQTGQRILGEDKERSKTPKAGLKKVHFGERAFVLKEFRESDYSEDELSEIEEISSNAFASFEKSKTHRDKGKVQTGKRKEKSKFSKRPCPIKCKDGQGIHSNGSLFFCNAFREKSKEERKELQKKTHVCIRCLAKVGQKHECPVGSCESCGGGHNILLCPREQESEDKAMLLGENEDPDDDSDNYTEDDSHYERNDNETVFLVRKSSPKTSTPKGSEKPKPKKEGDTEAKVPLQKVDEKISKEREESENKRKHEEKKLMDLKNYLRVLVEKIPDEKRAPQSCAAEVINLAGNKSMFSDRICFLQCGVIKETGEDYDNKREIEDRSGPTSDSEEESEGNLGDDETELTDSEDNLTEVTDMEGDSELVTESSEDYSEGTDTNDDSGSSGFNDAELESPKGHHLSADLSYCDITEIPARDTPSLVNSSGDETLDPKDSNLGTNKPSHSNVVKEPVRYMPNLVSDCESESASSDDSDASEDQEYSIDNGVFLVTSVTNLRRRQLFGLETSFEDRKKALMKNKKKKEISKGENASLEQIQDMLRLSLNEDERNVKKRSPRKSVFSEEKWENTGRWAEIIAEGAKEYGGFSEQIRLL